MVAMKKGYFLRYFYITIRKSTSCEGVLQKRYVKYEAKKFCNEISNDHFMKLTEFRNKLTYPIFDHIIAFNSSVALRINLTVIFHFFSIINRY